MKENESRARRENIWLKPVALHTRCSVCGTMAKRSPWLIRVCNEQLCEACAARVGELAKEEERG
jgi:hypothetical protein